MKTVPILPLLLAAALAPTAGAALDPSPSAPGSAADGAGAPRPAAAPRKTPRRASVADVSCERYLQLPESSRSMLIGWEVGQGYRKGSFAAWLVDAERSVAVAASVAEACRKAPAASFWYTVKAQLKRVR